MTDQFQFEPQDEFEQLDEREPERPLADRGVEEPLDEGYAPAEHWPAEAVGAPDGGTPREGAVETLEQRLEQEEPDVEDDWDDELLDESGDADAAGPEVTGASRGERRTR